MTNEKQPPSDETDAEQFRRNAREKAMKHSASVQLHGMPGPPLFELGRIVATTGAKTLLEQTRTDVALLLHRHRCFDAGMVSAHEADANAYALQVGARIHSVYELGDATQTLWIITDGDRSTTTVLLPDEYHRYKGV